LRQLSSVRLGRSGAAPLSTIEDVHLRAPSIDQGVQAFVWAVFFFLFLWVGMLAVGVTGGTAFILSLVAAGAIFLFVRLNGDDTPGRDD
jgi:hypothetical protein